MTERPEYHDDEINLRDYINVLIKRKVTIAVVFFVCVAAAAINSFTAPKVYQATASIMITPSKIQRIMSPSNVSLEVEEAATKGGLRSTISLPTHNELLKSNELLNNLINKLHLVDSEGKIISPRSLTEKLEIERKEGTNIINLYVKSGDPEKAREIANVWADEYLEYTKKLIAGEIRGTGQFIQEQFEIASQQLNDIEEEIKEFKDKYNLDLMKQELSMKKSKLNKEKKELIDLGLKLKTKKETLKQLKHEISQQDQFITVSKAITDESLWQQELKDRNTGKLDKKKLRSQVINSIYQDLKKRIVNTNIEINSLQPKIEYLENSISKTEYEINTLKKEINQKELKLARLNRQLNIRQKAYNSLANRIEEARMIKTFQLDEVKIVSFAALPVSAVAPKKKQNIAIAAVFGLFLGVFIAFFREFWVNSAVKGEE